MVFLSIHKKAFDTVEHDILLSKLDHYGIRGMTNNWFKSSREKNLFKSYIQSNVSKICYFSRFSTWPSFVLDIY